MKSASNKAKHVDLSKSVNEAITDDTNKPIIGKLKYENHSLVMRHVFE